MKTLSQRLANRISSGKTPKMKEKIEMSIFSALHYSNATVETIENFVSDCESGIIWSSDEFFDSSISATYNIFDYLINPEYTPIIKKLMTITPNIGTPNAATGEYEVMLLLTSKNVIKPKKGDIQHSVYGLKNLKGDSPRLFTEVRGKDLNKKMISEFKKYGIEIWKFRNVEYVQLMVEESINYYNEQFKKLNIGKDDLSNILRVWFNSLFPKNNKTQVIDLLIHESINDNQINWEKWIFNNVIFIFENSKDKDENFMVLNENGGVFHLTKDLENFKTLMSQGIIQYSSNYFRLNQDVYCGVYLKII